MEDPIFTPAVAKPSKLYCHWNVLGPVPDLLKCTSKVDNEALYPACAPIVNWKYLLPETAVAKLLTSQPVAAKEFPTPEAETPSPLESTGVAKFASVIVALTVASLPPLPLSSHAAIWACEVEAVPNTPRKAAMDKA